MDREIDDGEIHILNNELAYILFSSYSPFYQWDTSKIKEDLFKKYYQYLIKNNADEGRFSFIEREFAHSLVSPHFKHTIALKFERVPGDGLRDE